jgi:GTP-binding protein
LKKLTAMAKRRKLPFFPISAVTGEGVEALKYAIAEAVTAHRPARIEVEAPPPAKRKPNYPPPPSNARGRT